MSSHPVVNVTVLSSMVMKKYPYVKNEIGMSVDAYLEYRFFHVLERFLEQHPDLPVPPALIRPKSFKATDKGTIFVFRRIGYDLARCVREWVPYPRWKEPYAPKIAREILKVLIFMRDTLGAYHNDIKLENIVIDHDGVVGLIDYGATSVPEHSILDVDYIVYKPIYESLGTPVCKSPERANREITEPTEMAELWSLGKALEAVRDANLIRAEITRMTDPDPAKRGTYDDYLNI